MRNTILRGELEASRERTGNCCHFLLAPLQMQSNSMVTVPKIGTLLAVDISFLRRTWKVMVFNKKLQPESRRLRRWSAA